MYDEVIRNFSTKYDIEYDFLHALIKLESGYDCYAVRFEPNFKWIKNNEKYAEKFNVTEITMKILQATSFGLMQIMGSTALDMGFNQTPMRLVDPALNLQLGCMYLRKKIEIYGENPLDLYAAYNAGSVRKANNTYVNHAAVNRFKRYYERQKEKSLS